MDVHCNGDLVPPPTPHQLSQHAFHFFQNLNILKRFSDRICQFQKFCVSQNVILVDLKPIGADSALSPCQCIGDVENVERENPYNDSFTESA